MITEGKVIELFCMKDDHVKINLSLYIYYPISEYASVKSKRALILLHKIIIHGIFYQT